VVSTGSGAADLRERLNLRVNNKGSFREGGEKFYERLKCVDIELGYDKLTVRTVRLKLLTGPFTVGHLLYLRMKIILIFTRKIFVKPGKLKVRNAMKENMKDLHQKYSDINMTSFIS